MCPIVGLTYLPKVKHYYDTLGVGDLTLPFDAFQIQPVVEHVLSGWEKRGVLKAHLERRIPELQQEANRAAFVVAELAAGKDPAEIFSAFTRERRVVAAR